MAIMWTGFIINRVAFSEGTVGIQMVVCCGGKSKKSKQGNTHLSIERHCDTITRYLTCIYTSVEARYQKRADNIAFHHVEKEDT